MVTKICSEDGLASRSQIAAVDAMEACHGLPVPEGVVALSFALGCVIAMGHPDEQKALLSAAISTMSKMLANGHYAKANEFLGMGSVEKKVDSK